jgi:hypothetical protein
MSFAFSTEDMVLAPIGEEDDSILDSFAEGDEEISEDNVADAKMKTATLAATAENEIIKLGKLLGKLKTGTATRDEKNRIIGLNAKLDNLKEKIEVSKERDTQTELKMLRSTYHKKVTTVKTAIKERDIRSVIKAVCDAESVDLAFAVDCTASMASHIDSVKKNISEIVRRVKATNGNLKLRLAFVAYRGVQDDKEKAESLDFVSSVDDFESFVQKIGTRGGDFVANIAGGIQRVNGLNWSYPSRVVFLVCDMPCHGLEFGYDSIYPQGTPGIDIVSELRRLKTNAGDGTMTLNFGRITGHTDIMIRRFEDYGIHFDVAAMHNLDKIAACVTKGVRKSIFKTMTFSQGGMKSVAFAPVSDLSSLLQGRDKSMATGVSLKQYNILPMRPSVDEWTQRPAVEVNVFRNRGIKSIKDLQAPIESGILSFLRVLKGADGQGFGRTDKTHNRTMFLRCAKDPFAEGEIRIAYHGQLSRNSKDLEDPKNAMVMKSFKHVGKGLNNRTQYLEQMEVSTIAHFLVREYNKSYQRPSHCAMLRVLQVCVVEEEKEVNEKSGNRRFCAEEALPDGEFIKFSNNTGHWEEDHLDESLLRFTDFTYQATNGYLMVTDLQGVLKDNEFYLTDPVILCKDVMRFGHTNLGEKFMMKCIDSTRAYMKEKNWC